MKKAIISIIITLFLFFQSCVVYKPTPSPLHQAVNQGKVKITYQNRNWDKYENIILKNNEYYTVKRQRIKNERGIYEWTDVLTKIDSTTVTSVLIKDIKKSKTRTIILAVSAVPGAAALYVAFVIVMFTVVGI